MLSIHLSETVILNTCTKITGPPALGTQIHLRGPLGSLSAEADVRWHLRLAPPAAFHNKTFEQESKRERGRQSRAAGIGERPNLLVPSPAPPWWGIWGAPQDLGGPLCSSPSWFGQCHLAAWLRRVSGLGRG